MIKIIADRAVHIAQLCCKILILIGCMDVRQILCSAAPNPRAASLRILLSLINVSSFLHLDVLPVHRRREHKK